MTQTPPISAEQVEAAARAFDPLLFSDDAETAHMAASPYKVEVARGLVRADLLRALNAAASIPASRGALSPEQVSAAMLEAWNDICSDTGCHPLDIERQGKNLMFAPGHWARFTAMYLNAALAASPAPQPVQEQEPVAWLHVLIHPQGYDFDWVTDEQPEHSFGSLDEGYTVKTTPLFASPPAAETKVERLTEALKPFALVASEGLIGKPGEKEFASLTMAADYFHRARAALGDTP